MDKFDLPASAPSVSPPPGHYLRKKPIEGPRFIRIILLVCVLVTLLAVAIIIMVGRLREHYGLPGWE